MQKHKIEDKIFKELSPEEIIRYFQGKGISEEDISYVIKQRGAVSRLYAAAELFNQKGFHHFSGFDLAAIIYHNEWGKDSMIYITRVYSALLNHYRAMRNIKEELNMPYNHMLRIETGNNRSNLHRIRGYEIENNSLVKVPDRTIYPKVIPSRDDYREGVNLPLPEEVDTKIAKLFGYTWAAALIVTGQRGDPLLRYYGRESARSVLEEKVKPLLEETFKIEFKVLPENPRIVEVEEGRETELKGVVIEKGSSAITSFLMYEHSFPKPPEKDKKRLPNIEWNQDMIDHFLLGILELKASRDHVQNRPTERVRISGLREELAKRVSELLTRGGYTHSGPFPELGCSKYRIILNQDPTKHFKNISNLRFD